MRYLLLSLTFLCWITTLFGQAPLFADITFNAGTGNGPTNNNGIIIGDFDNDGFEDMFIPSRLDDNRLYKNMGNGTFLNVISSAASNRLYKNNGNNTFTLVSESSPLYSYYIGRGGTWADFNNDGFQDIVVANGQSFVGVGFRYLKIRIH